MVALAQLDEGVRALGHARQGRADLALAAGAEIQDLVLGPDAGLLFRQERLHVAQHADRLGGGGDAVHRAPGQSHATTCGLGGADHAVHARDVGGEAAHGDAALQVLDQGGQGHLHVALGARHAVHEDVGAVADHGQHALVAETLDRLNVSALAHDRIVVDLPVAGVQDGAQRGLDGQAVRLGDRVGDGDEGHVERTQVQVAAQRDLVQLDIVEDVGVAQLLADQVGGEGRRIQRRLDARPQPAQGADVVLMGVRQHDAQDVLAFQEGGIGHDHVHAGRGGIAEGHADVDENPFAVMRRAKAIGVEVHTDLVRAAQRQEDEFVVLSFLCHVSLEVGIPPPDFE
ncbi:hypothetical protein D3C86_1119500 [compost metagenome]